jgi:ElaB/YqjD/DUF883 family membrane-anchored ribosome-binding protein
MEKLNEFLNEFNDSNYDAKSWMNNISEMAEDINEKVVDVAKDCQHFAKEKPLAAIGIVAAAGVIFGMLIAGGRR